MTAAPERIYRTADGRHVLEGNPDAAFLAYPEGADVPADVLAELDHGATEKAAAPAANKARKPAGNKSA